MLYCFVGLWQALDGGPGEIKLGIDGLEVIPSHLLCWQMDEPMECNAFEINAKIKAKNPRHTTNRQRHDDLIAPLG